MGGTTGEEACTQDCADVWGGAAYTDECGNCVGGTTGLEPCVKDCADVWGGSAYVDECGNCVGGTTGLEPCVKDCAGVEKWHLLTFGNLDNLVGRDHRGEEP